VQRRTAYNNYGGENSDEGLLSARTLAEVDSALTAWERQHPDRCDRQRDDGQFFGFTNNAVGKLQRATNFVFIPAVRDATLDVGTARGAAIGRLMDLVVRSSIESREEIRAFKARISTEYRALMDPARLPELGGLAAQLSTTLQNFYANAGVVLQWGDIDDIDAPLPTAGRGSARRRTRSAAAGGAPRPWPVDPSMVPIGRPEFAAQ